MNYNMHEMNVTLFKVKDAIVFTVSDGGESEYHQWSIKPDRSDS